jgi:FixJ family two-component response regulator
VVAIAIVDDDESILDAMTLLVEGQGWDAKVYASGEAFLDDYHHNGKIDCLILDPHLGGISGADVAQALNGSNIPIIGLTARPESPVTQSIIELGVETMLTKPAQPKHLVETIKQAIEFP